MEVFEGIRSEGNKEILKPKSGQAEQEIPKTSSWQHYNMMLLLISWILNNQKAICMAVQLVNQPCLKTCHSVTTMEKIQYLKSEMHFQC
jgi:hypothetical protein